MINRSITYNSWKDEEFLPLRQWKEGPDKYLVISSRNRSGVATTTHRKTLEDVSLKRRPARLIEGFWSLVGEGNQAGKRV